MPWEMEFRILGPLEVVGEGQLLPPLPAKRRTLLAVLLLNANEVVTTDVLIDALWGGQAPATAQTVLHGHVSALRKVLGAARIETRSSGYLLRLEAGELDKERFATLVDEAHAIEDPGERSKRLGAALALWRGDALADFRYDEFAQAEIAQLEERRRAAIEERIEADLALGHHGRLLPELGRLLLEEPLRERPRAQLMLALYRAGRQGEALRAFQEGRRLLAEELGIAPGPVLQALERQILAQDPSLELPKPPAATRLRQERKWVTVLMAELSGPSDPEELGRLLGPALTRTSEILSGFGATVQPLFMNAVLGLFGAPRAHEDDAERAVRAATALVDVVGAEGLLAVRIGVEHGEALVTIEGDRVELTGDVVAAASRLQARAADNEIALGDVVRRLTSAPGRRGDAQFVGREHELGLLERTYGRVVREGAAELVTVVGDPGSGKTRLAQEFRALLERKEPHTLLEGHCLPYGEGVTFWALGEIVKAQTGILESDDAETSGEKLAVALEALLAESTDRVWVEQSLAPLVGLGGTAGGSREQSFAGWRRFLESVAEQRPLVLLIEDLHWADAALVEFVDDLAERAVGVPLLVLCTARLELLDRHPQWAGGKRNATTITLAPLNAQETRDLARSLLDGGEPSEALVLRAGGNPLFAQELARIEATEAAALPESLQAVIAARLDTLAPEVKQVAMDAAVIGEMFWPGAVAAIARSDEAEVDERLRRLVAGDIVRRARTSSVKGQGEYAFLHVLVRDVAYEQIPRGQRAQKHAAAAAWIEQLAGERVIDRAELIAHHYAAALEHAAGDAELIAETRHYLVLAGDRAMQLDVAAAERLYRGALELFDPHDAARLPVLLALARTVQEAGRLEESTGLYEEAIVELRARGDRVTLGGALVDYEWALWRDGRAEEVGGNAVREAVELLEREPPGPELARAYNFMARQSAIAGRPTECLDWVAKAMTLATALDLGPAMARALQTRGIARCDLNDLDGLDDLREALRLGLEVGAGIDTATAYNNLAQYLFHAEGPERALELFDEGIEFSERRGFAHYAGWLRMATLELLFELGRWDDLLARADELVAWERSSDETQITTAVFTHKAAVFVRRGAVAEAKSLTDALLEPARTIGDPQTLVPALICAALVEQAIGDHAAAIQLVEEIETSIRGRTVNLWMFDAADIARICATAPDVELGKRLFTDVEVSAAHQVAGLVSARAVLAETEGSLDEALAGYAEAAAGWHEFGNVFEEACALLGRGRCLLGLDRREEAAGPLARARTIFEQLGASPLVSEVDGHLSLSGVH